MHPPRRKSAIERQGVADRLVDWLLTRCPFSTLAVLITIVIGPTVGPLPQPLLLAGPVVMADLLLNVGRRLMAGSRVAERG